MAVYSSNLIIKTGTTFEQVFTLEDGVSNSPINLTNFGVAAQMRKHAWCSDWYYNFYNIHI